MKLYFSLFFGESMNMDPTTLTMLSASTRAALLSHMNLAEPEAPTSSPFEHVRNTNAGVDENFGMSQFWYSSETAHTLAMEAINIGGLREKLAGYKRIAFLSCPSTYKAAIPFLPEDTEAVIFEYDRRFGGVYGDQFVYYDFNYPENIPADMIGTFDYIMADPPYIDEFTMMQFYKSMKLLARDENVPMCFCTGSNLADIFYENIQFRECKFHPEHASLLRNEFSCFTNYESKDLLGWYPVSE